MQQTVLLTLGRLPKALDIARALNAAGCRVLVAEPHRRHLTGASKTVTRSFQVCAPVIDRDRYRDQLLEIIQNEAVDLVVPISEECLYVAELQDEIPKRCQIFTTDPASVRELHDKSRFNALCRTLGLNAPETHALDSKAADDLGRRAATVVKGRYSAAGKGLQFLAVGAPRPLLDGSWLRQSRIDGDLISTFSIVSKGRVIGNVCYAADVLSGTVAVSFVRRPLDAALTGLIETVARATEYHGFLSLDIIRDSDDRYWPIECNPRVTSGVHFVEPESLATAILEPESTYRLALRRNRRLQQFYTTLTETQMAPFGRGDFFKKLKTLVTTPDVTFAWNDLSPAVLMTWHSWEILGPTLFHGKTFGEAATGDIDWSPRSGAP